MLLKIDTQAPSKGTRIKKSGNENSEKKKSTNKKNGSQETGKIIVIGRISPNMSSYPTVYTRGITKYPRNWFEACKKEKKGEKGGNARG